MKKIIQSVILAFTLQIAFGQNAASVKQPTLMIIPSDNLLTLLNCIEIIDNQGVKTIKKDYKKAFRENSDLNMAISAIEKKFSQYNFPIVSLELALNDADNTSAANIIDDIKDDPYTQMMRQTKPDIILDLTYESKKTALGYKLTFVLRALDSYTLKSVSSIGSPGEITNTSSVPQMIADQVEKNLESFQKDLGLHFEKTRQLGREVRFKVQVLKSSNIDLEMNECGGEFINDYISKWVKANSKNGAYKRQSASSVEISFTEVRIPLYDETGQGFGIEDWVKPLRKALLKDCGFYTIDRTSGLGDGRLVISKQKQL